MASMASLAGGLIYGSTVMMGASGALAPEAREVFLNAAGVHFRRIVRVAILGLLISGVFNILTNTGHSRQYHIWLGIKLLLVLHVFAVALGACRPDNPKRGRRLAGGAVSALIVIAISAYLRHIF